MDTSHQRIGAPSDKFRIQFVGSLRVTFIFLFGLYKLISCHDIVYCPRSDSCHPCDLLQSWISRHVSLTHSNLIHWPGNPNVDPVTWDGIRPGKFRIVHYQINDCLLFDVVRLGTAVTTIETLHFKYLSYLQEYICTPLLLGHTHSCYAKNFRDLSCFSTKFNDFYVTYTNILMFFNLILPH